MLNILFGIGIGGVWMGIMKVNKCYRKYLDRLIEYKLYYI